MNTRKLNLLFLIALLSYFVVLNILVPARAETEQQNASFVRATYSSRILAGARDTWTFAIYNANCSENGQSGARFFLVMHSDGELLLNEYNDTQYKTWVCNKSSTVTRNYGIRGWQALSPVTHQLQVELYSTEGDTFHLEDKISFTIDVAMRIPLQHIYATGYFVAYLLTCFALFSYVYVKGLDD